VPRAADTLLAAMGARGSEESGWYETLAESDFRLAAPVPIFPRLNPPEA
jgi:hypothetical protein